MPGVALDITQLGQGVLSGTWVRDAACLGERWVAADEIGICGFVKMQVVLSGNVM